MEFLAELASGLLLFAATPPRAGTRTLTRTQFLDSAFSPESGLGAAQRTSRVSSPPLRIRARARAHTQGLTRGHLGASLRGGHLTFVTFVLALP